MSYDSIVNGKRNGIGCVSAELSRVVGGGGVKKMRYSAVWIISAVWNE